MAKKTAILNIRVTEEQKALIETVAEYEGMTVSEWCRKIIMAEVIKQYNELIASERTYCIYKLTFPDGSCYIGQTKQVLENRWGKNGNGYNGQYVSHGIHKFGWESVSKEVLESGLSKQEANLAEYEYMVLYNSLVPNGWNASWATGWTSCSKEFIISQTEQTLKRFESLPLAKIAKMQEKDLKRLLRGKEPIDLNTMCRKIGMDIKHYCLLQQFLDICYPNLLNELGETVT